jgi:type IV pilus assembly protein PilE
MSARRLAHDAQRIPVRQTRTGRQATATPRQRKRSPRQMRVSVAGFTLIELMVVVLVAAILVAIAVPSYQSQIQHARRTDAKTALLDAAVREEKYRSLSNSYTVAPDKLGYASLPIQIGSNNYYWLNVCVGSATVSTAATTPCPTTTSSGTSLTSFVVSAVPVAGTSQAGDTSCQYFAVDNTGVQYSTDSTTGSGTTDTTSTCWQ